MQWRWPWKPNPEDVEASKRARAHLDRVLADWQPILEAVEPIREGRIRNHITERAFALREKGSR